MDAPLASAPFPELRGSEAGREVRSRHMNAAEGPAAVGRMIAACRHSDRAATEYEIAW